MKIFYIDTEKYLIDIDFLKSFADRKSLSEEKEKQHCFG